MKNKRIYVMFNEATNLVKVGMSNDTKIRARTISNHCGTTVVVMYESDLMSNADVCEKLTHKKLSKNRCLGEWFNCSVSDAISSVKMVVIESMEKADYSNQDDSESDDIESLRGSCHATEKVCAYEKCDKKFYGGKRARYCCDKHGQYQRRLNDKVKKGLNDE